MITVGSMARWCVAAALVGVTLGAAEGQTAAKQGAQSPANLARALAETIKTTTPAVPDSPYALEAATSHDNVVELRYVVKGAANFARFKGNLENLRLAKASFFCNPSRVAILDLGVVIHEVTILADHSDQVEFTIDRSSCPRLPRPAQADAKTLAELALAAAKEENEGGAQRPNPLHFVGATAHQGVVDLRFTVDAAAAAQMDRTTITGLLTGQMCFKYRDSIARGLAFHPVFTVDNGAPIVDFIIDHSTC